MNSAGVILVTPLVITVGELFSVMVRELIGVTETTVLLVRLVPLLTLLIVITFPACNEPKVVLALLFPLTAVKFGAESTATILADAD